LWHKRGTWKYILGKKKQSLFAKRLTEIRENSEKSQTKFAQEIKINYKTYCNYEKTTEPPIRIMIKIIENLGISFDYFFAPFSDKLDKEILEIIEKIKTLRKNPDQWNGILKSIDNAYEIEKLKLPPRIELPKDRREGRRYPTLEPPPPHPYGMAPQERIPRVGVPRPGGPPLRSRLA
jgi:transcriptional regulator with XRE-family HTH domain